MKTKNFLDRFPVVKAEKLPIKFQFPIYPIYPKIRNSNQKSRSSQTTPILVPQTIISRVKSVLDPLSRTRRSNHVINQLESAVASSEEGPHRGPCFSREEIKERRGRGSARIRNRGEWLLRVCSRLEEGVARGKKGGKEGQWLRMRTNDPSTRPYSSSWEPSQSFASTRAYRESNCDPSRRARTKTCW